MSIDKKDVWFEDSIAIEDFLELREEVNFQYLSEEEAERVLAHTSYITAAWYGGQCIGLIRVLTDYCVDAYITDVIVHPNCQGQGIGYMLVERALNHLRENSMSVRMACVIYTNQGREPFYSSLGFETLPNDRYGAGMILEMQKEEESNIE